MHTVHAIAEMRYICVTNIMAPASVVSVDNGIICLDKYCCRQKIGRIIWMMIIKKRNDEDILSIRRYYEKSV